MSVEKSITEGSEAELWAVALWGGYGCSRRSHLSDTTRDPEGPYGNGHGGVGLRYLGRVWQDSERRRKRRPPVFGAATLCNVPTAPGGSFLHGGRGVRPDTGARLRRSSRRFVGVACCFVVLVLRLSARPPVLLLPQLQRVAGTMRGCACKDPPSALRAADLPCDKVAAQPGSGAATPRGG